MDTRLKLAFLSPLNPVQSGISDYSEELLPYLARYADIDLYVDDYTPTNKEITRQFAVYPASKFSRQSGRYDTYLFHMGNSAAHSYIYRALQNTAGQGILVLHDFVLHHFLIGEYLNHGKAPEYIRQMARRYGAEGEKLAREVIKGRFAESLFYYPLNETALEAGRAVLVHSQYARHLIEKAYPAKPVGVACMGVPLPPLVSKAEARARLGLSDDEFVLFSLGHLNPYKRLDSALWAYRAFSREFPNSRFVLAGSLSPNYNVRAMIEALGLTRRVELPGYTSPEQSRDYLAAADVCLNLRYPTAGETSASLLRIMGAGRAVLVSRTGAFEELPDDSCIKVDVDDAEEELLLEYLRLLARRPEVKEALGRNARRYVAGSARLADAAHDYYLFLCRVLGREPVIQPEPASTEVEFDELDLLSELKQAGLGISRPASAVATSVAPAAPSFDELAQAAADIGLDENDPALAEIVRAARFTGLI